MRNFSNHIFSRPKIQQSILGINPFALELIRNLDIKSHPKCSFSPAGLEKDSGLSIPNTQMIHLVSANKETLEAL